MNKYRTKEIIEAKHYKPGDEDGFSTRYCNPDDYKKFEEGKLKAVGTWGIPRNDADREIEVPYIIVGKRKVFVGENYTILYFPNGEIKTMHTHVFNERYERITEE